MVTLSAAEATPAPLSKPPKPPLPLPVQLVHPVRSSPEGPTSTRRAWRRVWLRSSSVPSTRTTPAHTTSPSAHAAAPAATVQLDAIESGVASAGGGAAGGAGGGDGGSIGQTSTATFCPLAQWRLIAHAKYSAPVAVATAS